MRISYSLIALVCLMPPCIGFAYFEKLHWQQEHQQTISVEPDKNLAVPTVPEAPKAIEQTKKVTVVLPGNRCYRCYRVRQVVVQPQIIQLQPRVQPQRVQPQVAMVQVREKVNVLRWLLSPRYRQCIRSQRNRVIDILVGC